MALFYQKKSFYDTTVYESTVKKYLTKYQIVMKGVDTNKYMKNKFGTVNVFLAMSMLGIVVFFSLAPFLRQKALEWLVMENNPKYIATDFQLAELWSQKLGGGLRK